MLILLQLEFMMRYIYSFIWFLFSVSQTFGTAAPNIIVTIKPIHSLVASLMKNVANPTLLLKGDQSPHTQVMTPDQIKQLQSAQVVIWIGPSYETHLKRALDSVKTNCHIITLMNQPSVRIYPLRQGGLWGKHTHEHEETDHQCHAQDGHIWLDPRNAQAIVKALLQEFISLDPDNKETYLKNAHVLMERLEILDQNLEALLQPVRNKAYILYHDGTQYFDKRFHTKAIGALINDAHHGTKARHLLKIRQLIRHKKVKCIFTEPQFSIEKVRVLSEQTGVRVEMLDYLGIDISAGEDAYFLMMHKFADAFLKGLE